MREPFTNHLFRPNAQLATGGIRIARGCFVDPLTLRLSIDAGAGNLLETCAATLRRGQDVQKSTAGDFFMSSLRVSIKPDGIQDKIHLGQVIQRLGFANISNNRSDSQHAKRLGILLGPSHCKNLMSSLNPGGRDSFSQVSTAKNQKLHGISFCGNASSGIRAFC